MKNQSNIDAANAAFWDELCGSYLAQRLGITDRTAASLKQFDEAYMRLYPYLNGYLANIKPAGRRVMEIGLGYGTVGQLLASLAGDYLGVDISPGPVGMMEHRLRLAGLRGRAVVGSAHHLPAEDESFDVVVSIGVFHHTGDVQRCIDETHRVLVRGGRALIMVYNLFSYRQWLRWPLKSAAALTGLSSVAEGSAEQRRAYDARLDGGAAPETVFTSSRNLKQMFNRYAQVEIRKENFNVWTLQGRDIVPRAVMLDTAGRLAGLDLYATAMK